MRFAKRSRSAREARGLRSGGLRCGRSSRLAKRWAPLQSFAASFAKRGCGLCTAVRLRMSRNVPGCSSFLPLV